MQQSHVSTHFWTSPEIVGIVTIVRTWAPAISDHIGGAVVGHQNGDVDMAKKHLEKLSTHTCAEGGKR